MYRVSSAHRTVYSVGFFLFLLLSSVAAAKQPYKYNEAWRAHFFSRASYCKMDLIRSWTCGSPCARLDTFKPVAVFSSFLIGTSGFVGVDHAKRQIVVAFRGTNNLQNILADVSALQVDYGRRSSCGRQCRVHTGFFDSYKSLRQQTRKAVLNLVEVNPTYEILITGHSLGGALATLASADLQESLNGSPNLYPPWTISLYTFGSPRVGNAAFAKWVDALLVNGTKYRITHRLDPVVRTPARLWGYVHTTTEVFFTSRANTSVVICNDSPGKEDRGCSLSKTSIWIDDHMYYMGDTIGCK
ncbi:hypothetical protein JKF63_03821 [Porcisia hertigi]|uniref:Fungal lipase-type domain-containing protein n=1 Tax=Porcisia hertigi TaxID=2761500 RepID=A0A836L568_9TRYP|nr:hypothetical protein JKF63_03821 [Porcisia hertigi]